MNQPIRIDGAEITIVGVTFVCDYTYYPELSATLLSPPEDAQVEIRSCAILNQPGSDADELLTAIKTHLRGGDKDKFGIQYKDGFDLLEEYVLENPPC